MPNTFQVSTFRRGNISAKQVFALTVIIILILIISYSLLRFLFDQYNYQKAHQAYSQINCVNAVPRYEKILNGYRLIDLAGVYELAQEEMTQCLHFLDAFEEQQNQDYSGALLKYLDFIKMYRESILVEEARSRAVSIFGLTRPSTLASQDTCSQIPSLLEEELIPQQEVNLSLLYLACGLVYDEANMRKQSYDMYEAFLNQFPENPFAQTVERNLIANPVACENIKPLQRNSLISIRLEFFPRLYQSCGNFYVSANDPEAAFEIYILLLEDYPQHSFTADAENYILTSHFACEKVDSLTSNEALSAREDFIPRLIFNCGQMYEETGERNSAIGLYEKFLSAYPDHALSREIAGALARLIVEQAAEQSAGQISPPQLRGGSGTNNVEVVIQNDSPERMRIIFSGPEPRIEELEACGSCIKYNEVGPQYCPQSGPFSTYTLQPGAYDVVVESISGGRVTPWTGTWDLGSGSSYYSCFVIITKNIP